MDYLKKNPSGKWAEMESVINSAFVSTPSFQKLGMMSNYAFQKMTLRNKFGIIEHTIEKAEVTQQLGKPFVKGIMMLLAAWGMVDIACREVEKTDVSPYDSLLYFRINDFGAYSLGIKKDYSPLRHEKQELFHLDPDRLIIRSLAENNPYMTLLFDTCIPIGNGRFRADAATMLAHCKTRKDVEDKVNFFKRYISGDLPDVWNDFFHNLLQRCKPFHEEDNRKYKIFTLSEENKPLIHLLTSDPILRQLFLRAEKHYLIVPVANLAQFEKRLNSLGYLL